MFHRNRFLLTLSSWMIGLWLVSPAWGEVSIAWQDPGWTYAFTCDPHSATGFDKSWKRSNDWDGSTIGEGMPGGISKLTEGTATFFRLQDAGSPSAYGFTGRVSNRRIRMTHDLRRDGATGDFLHTGTTLSFRARIATPGTGPLDDQYPNIEGGVSKTSSWPSEGIGSTFASGNRGNFALWTATSGTISFSLALAKDMPKPSMSGGLFMNHKPASLAQTRPSEQDIEDVNVFPISDLTIWHEFWITIQAAKEPEGTYRIDIYMDGHLNPASFIVAASKAGEAGSDCILSVNAFSAEMCAFDCTFIAWKEGVVTPEPPIAKTLDLECVQDFLNESAKIDSIPMLRARLEKLIREVEDRRRQQGMAQSSVKFTYYQALAQFGDSAGIERISSIAYRKLLELHEFKVDSAMTGLPLGEDFAVDTCPPHDISVFWKAHYDYSRKQYAEAATLFEALGRGAHEPLRSQALYDLGIITLRQHRVSDALKYLKSCATLLPQSEPLRKALQTAEEAQLLDSRNHEIYANLATQRKIADSANNPEASVQALLTIADSEMKLHGPARAVAALEEIVLKYPQSTWVGTALSRLVTICEKDLKDTKRAKRYRDRLSEESPADTTLSINNGAKP